LPETEAYLSAGEKVTNVTLLNNDLRLAKTAVTGSVMVNPRHNLLPEK
jgi:hypothetical protein